MTKATKRGPREHRQRLKGSWHLDQSWGWIARPFTAASATLLSFLWGKRQVNMHPPRAGWRRACQPFSWPAGAASPPLPSCSPEPGALACALPLQKRRLLYLWSSFLCLTAPTQKPLPPALLAQPWPSDKVWPEMLGGQPQSSRVAWMARGGGYSQQWRRHWWRLPGSPGWTWMQVKAERYRISGPQGAQSSHPCKRPQPRGTFPPSSLRGRRKGRPLGAKGIHASLSTAPHMETRSSYVQGDAEGPTALLPYSRKVLGRHLAGSRRQQGPK